jgi:hypothetical protein
MDEQVEEFLRAKTFKCPYLSNARLTPEQCDSRQSREIEVAYFGRKINLNNTPQDRFCRSGECKLGACIRKHLRGKAAQKCEAQVRRAEKQVAGR